MVLESEIVFIVVINAFMGSACQGFVKNANVVRVRHITKGTVKYADQIMHLV